MEINKSKGCKYIHKNCDRRDCEIHNFSKDKDKPFRVQAVRDKD